MDKPKISVGFPPSQCGMTTLLNIVLHENISSRATSGRNINIIKMPLVAANDDWISKK